MPGYCLRHGINVLSSSYRGFLMNKSPEQLAKAAHDSKELVFSPYLSGTNKHDRYVNELFKLTTEAGKKR